MQNNKKRMFFDAVGRSKGQSFVELALIFSILINLMAGMVEFGNLLNQYINVVDGAREGARFGSNDDPFTTESDGVTPHYETFFGQIYTIIQGEYDSSGAQLSKGAINPIVLDENPDSTDDILVTFFSITGNKTSGAKGIVRFESAAGSRYNKATTESKFTNDQILDMVDGFAPSTGVLLVEIFYSYNQILKLFSFTGIPDPVNLHAYSIMPLSAAEPTPTPRP